MYGLKEGHDVAREDGTLLSVAELTYRPYKPRSFAYVGDTAVFDGLSDMVKGVDLLYHEATFGDDCADKAAQMFHCTARDAAETALRAGAGRLVIGHFSSRYKDTGVLLRQAREVFPNTEAGMEGAVFDIPEKNC